MLSEILADMLTRLEEYEKTNPDEIKYRRTIFDTLKNQITFHKGYWATPTPIEKELNKNKAEIIN